MIPNLLSQALLSDHEKQVEFGQFPNQFSNDDHKLTEAKVISF